MSVTGREKGRESARALEFPLRQRNDSGFMLAYIQDRVTKVCRFLHSEPTIADTSIPAEFVVCFAFGTFVLIFRVGFISTTLIHIYVIGTAV